MTNTVHHATAALARKHGISLTANNDDTFTATKDGHTSTDPVAKVAVGIVLDKLPKAPKVKKARKAAKGSKRKNGKKPAKSGVMVYHYYERYRKNGGNNGDDLAAALKAATTTIDKGKSGKANRLVFDVKALIAIARENGIKDSFTGLNNGMIRMDISNKLRAAHRNGEKLVIQGKTFKGHVAAAGNQGDDGDE